MKRERLSGNTCVRTENQTDINLKTTTIMASNFWQSSHRWTYVSIAMQHLTSPMHVFDLAHGNADFQEEDEAIMHSLRKAGIVHRRHSIHMHAAFC